VDSVDYMIDWYLWACWRLPLICGILMIYLMLWGISKSNPLCEYLSVHDGPAADIHTCSVQQLCLLLLLYNCVLP